jgi:methionyl-tRNA formyltransferase
MKMNRTLSAYRGFPRSEISLPRVTCGQARSRPDRAGILRRIATVALLANDVPGLRVAEYLHERGDEIVAVYLHAPERRRQGDEIVSASGCRPDQVHEAAALRDPEGVAALAALAPDFLITVYWAHLISPEAIAAARRGTVNFHPALLPVNRGWFPHVWSIVDGTPTGVTLHAVDASADTGPVWAQREVPLTPYDTAGSIYARLQDEIVALFRETWPAIADGSITPAPQDDSRAVYHDRSDVAALDELRLDDVMRVGDVIDRLRARSFGSRGFAWYEVGGERVYANLRLGRTSEME